MRFSERIDEFVADQFATGRFNSEATERGYRFTLERFAAHIGNRDPRTIGRNDIKSFLAKWTGNTRGLYHSHLVSFFDWGMEEGHWKQNVARQVRRTKPRKPNVYRLTRDEVRAFRRAVKNEREQTVAELGLLGGLRAKEILGLQGRHFRRDGWIWVSADIGKGSKERWVRVLPELEPTWRRLSKLANDEYALPKRTSHMAGLGRMEGIRPSQPLGYDALYKMVLRIGERAGIAAPVTPHLLRHAYADHIVRFAGIEIARALLGHESIKTTQRYAGQSTLDEIAAALEGFGYGYGELPPEDSPLSAHREPVERLCPQSLSWQLERAAAEFGAVLAALRNRPAFREAAGMVPHG